jgi:hypothetical protein
VLYHIYGITRTHKLCFVYFQFHTSSILHAVSVAIKEDEEKRRRIAIDRKGKKNYFGV